MRQPLSGTVGGETRRKRNNSSRYTAVGRRLEAAIDRADLTNREFAERLGVDEMTVSRWIHRREPTRAWLERIGGELGMHWSDFFDLTRQKWEWLVEVCTDVHAGTDPLAAIAARQPRPTTADEDAAIRAAVPGFEAFLRDRLGPDWPTRSADEKWEVVRDLLERQRR